MPIKWIRIQKNYKHIFNHLIHCCIMKRFTIDQNSIKTMFKYKYKVCVKFIH